jgi:DNA-binding Xre family transcriptional regulator
MKILLAQVMYEKNISIRQLSLRSGVPKSTIQDDMNEDSNPKIRTLEKLAIALNCQITDLFDSNYK